MSDTEKKIAKIRAKVTPIKHIPRGTGETLELLFNIQFLLDELERKDEENRKLREERDRLIEALRLYADSRNWAGDVFAPPEGIPPEVDDGGQRARDILREVGVTVE